MTSSKRLLAAKIESKERRLKNSGLFTKESLGMMKVKNPNKPHKMKESMSDFAYELNDVTERVFKKMLQFVETGKAKISANLIKKSTQKVAEEKRFANKAEVINI